MVIGFESTEAALPFFNGWVLMSVCYLAGKPNMKKVISKLLQARELQAKGDLKAAADLFETCMLENHDEPAAFTGWAEICASRGLVEEGLRGFDEALRLEGTYLPALLGRARLLLDLGEPEAAMEDLEVAENTNPDDADVMVLKGYALLDLHWNKDAAACFRRAMALNPNLPGIEEALARLGSESIPLWHFTMLVDHARNQAYREVIERAVKPGMHVLDIGAGTGLLSMMAAKAGAELVTCVEMGKEMASVAQRVIALNGYEDQIRMFNLHSGWLRVGEHLPRKVDIVVSEIVDAALLGEGVLPSLRHAWSSLAAPGARMIPASATVHGMLLNLPVASLKDVEGFDLSVLESYHYPGGSRNVRLNQEKHQALSEPFVVGEFDFTDIPPAVHDEQRIHTTAVLKASSQGCANAVVVWFTLHLDSITSVGSGPNDSMDHWGQLCYFLPQEIHVEQGQEITLHISRNDTRWWFRV
jgi:hypothetical protein